MKTKIVLWGKTENDEKVLVAVELVETDNLVKTHVIPESEATEIFYNRMLNEWRFETEIEFPEGTKSFEKHLTLTEDILPEGLKVDRQDLILRAKTEWHFVVLSKKLFDLYSSELEDFRERIDKLTEFDNGVWEELKGLWTKVQGQIQEKNLFRNHIDSLRNKTDELFRDLKDLKKRAEKDLREDSKRHYSQFSEIMEKVEEKIESGLGLQPLFEELKDIQDQFKKTSFTREHRRQLWDRIDQSFKAIKEKRYGGNPEDRSPMARLQRRYDGLLNAIEKMERSISRDKKDLSNQDKQVDSSLGQLEMEIRKVKMSMVGERIQSKEDKLKDMMKTKTMLESRLEAEREKEEKRKMFEEAKKEAEEKIHHEIQQRHEELGKNEEELKKAAEMIIEDIKEEEKSDEKAAGEEKQHAKKEEEPGKKQKKSFFEEIGDKLEEAAEEAREIAEDIVDSTRATAKVLGDKLDHKIEEWEDKAEKMKDTVEEKMDKLEDDLEEKTGEMKKKFDEKTGGLGSKIVEKAEKLEDKIEETMDKIKSRITGEEEE
jgi:hypothetical protein